jgi:hypothetical protein
LTEPHQGGRVSRRSLQHALALTLIALAVGYLFFALLDRHGFLAHDGLDGYLRTQQYLKEIQGGHVPPQLFPDAISGGGYAFPRFYPPLGYLVAAFLAWITQDVVLGYHLALFLSVLASGWAMYFTIVVLTEMPALALFAALAYVSFPYRVTDVLQRAALAEAWTFVWYPLVFAGAWRVIQGRRVPAYLPVSVAGLALTHPTSALYAFCLFLAIGLLARRHVARDAIARLVLAGIVAVGLIVWWVLPETKDIKTVWAGDPVFMWARPTFADSNRASVPFLVDADTAPNGLHLNLGLIGLVLLGATIGSVLALRHRAPAIDRRLYRLGLALSMSWWGIVAFMLAPLPALMVLPTIFAYIQFPWRLLGLAGFVACTGAALVLASTARSRIFSIAGILVGVGLVCAIPQDRRDVNRKPEWTSATVTEIGRGPYSVKGYTILGEYLPREASIEEINDRIRAGPVGTEGIEVGSWRRSGSGWLADVQAARPGQLVLPVVCYGLYRVFDGDETIPYHSDKGLLAVSLTAGTHHLRVTRHLPLVNRIGIAISALTILVAVLLRYRGFG